MRSRVWVTGDAVVDLIPDGEDRYLKCPGGAPANVAIGISRLGGDAGFFGRIGDDPFGRFMIDTLKKEEVDTDYLKLDCEHRTSTVLVDIDDSGERSFTFMVKPSADQFTEQQDVPLFDTGQWLHICSIALANEPSRSTTLHAMQKMKLAGGYVSFDLNLREEVWTNTDEIIHVVHDALRLCDVVKFSDDELLYLSGCVDIESATNWFDVSFSLPLVVITKGKEGALIMHQGEQELISGKMVKPVDTTGAGDAFVAGLLTGLAYDSEWQKPEVLRKIIKRANGCGALATTAKGAVTALPSSHELDNFLLG